MTINTASQWELEKARLSYARTVYLDWPHPLPENEHGDVEYRLDRQERTANEPLTWPKPDAHSRAANRFVLGYAARGGRNGHR